jgi:hypothetical protein
LDASHSNTRLASSQSPHWITTSLRDLLIVTDFEQSAKGASRTDHIQNPPITTASNGAACRPLKSKTISGGGPLMLGVHSATASGSDFKNLSNSSTAIRHRPPGNTLAFNSPAAIHF